MERRNTCSMKTLFIDRSGQAQSLCLVDDQTIVRAEVLGIADGRSGEWVQRTQDFIADETISRMVVGLGPGSFAGIRAALAFCQGYRAGSGCEVLGLPSPCALAREGEPLAVVGDARQGRFWVALFDGLRLVGQIFQVDAATLPLRVPLGAKVITPDDRRIDELLRETFDERYLGGCQPTAEGLARFAIANPGALSTDPLPVYLNPAVRPA